MSVQSQGCTSPLMSTVLHSCSFLTTATFTPPCMYACTPAGKEWQDDGATLGQLDMRSRGAVVTATECGAPNSFTQLPSEYRPEWEANSKTWMLTQQVGAADCACKQWNLPTCNVLLVVTVSAPCAV